jgi:hypothetical protein
VAIDATLAEIRQANGDKTPNILHVPIDDLSFGTMGNRALNDVSGVDTPNINALVEKGVSLMQMSTESSRTPRAPRSRAATSTAFEGVSSPSWRRKSCVLTSLKCCVLRRAAGPIRFVIRLGSFSSRPSWSGQPGSDRLGCLEPRYRIMGARFPGGRGDSSAPIAFQHLYLLH